MVYGVGTKLFVTSAFTGCTELDCLWWLQNAGIPGGSSTDLWIKPHLVPLKTSIENEMYGPIYLLNIRLPAWNNST